MKRLPIDIELAREVRTRRKKLRLTQNMLSLLSGVSFSMVEGLEQLRNGVRDDVRAALLQALDRAEEAERHRAATTQRHLSMEEVLEEMAAQQAAAREAV